MAKPRTRVLLIDGGQSGSRARFVESTAAPPKQRALAGAAPGVSVFTAPEPSSRKATGTRRRAARRGPGLPRRGRDYGALRVLLDGRVDLVAAGLTGFDGGAAAVARALGVPVIVSNDAVTAHLGALGGEPGVVLVAGTGVIALAVGPDGRWARADGHGNRLGDDGGGYWIGRRGLAAALRTRDGRPGGSPELLRRAEARFGERIVATVYDVDDPVAVIADFARDVAAAANEGDELAASIWADAARELAATALAAARALPAPAGEAAQRAAAAAGDASAAKPRPKRKRAAASGRATRKRAAPSVVSYAGGLFAAGELLLAPLRAELPDLREPLGDALDGAARLLERPPLFKDLIFEAGAP
jgi:N-acetylglucosamine kinase-like BadF-type ATPase